MFKQKKYIIFDLDGTLLDSVGMWNEVDRRFIYAMGHSAENIDVQAQRDAKLREFKASEHPYREYCAFMGKKYGSALSADELLKLRYEIADELVANTVDYKPYADVFIKKLKSLGYTMIIASTTLRSNLNVYLTRNRNIIDKAPLDSVFDAMYTREDAKEMKPSPEIYNRVLKDFNACAEECIIFEDSLIGVEAANAAGIDVIAMYDEHSACDKEEIAMRAISYFKTYKELMEKLSWEF
ncbi:MAG: HAD family hydrolase [Ruminococcaceae bacterium]|nr:HAD family hydrolase [Oscillospiraceae bacterium]